MVGSPSPEGPDSPPAAIVRYGFVMLRNHSVMFRYGFAGSLLAATMVLAPGVGAEPGAPSDAAAPAADTALPPPAIELPPAPGAPMDLAPRVLPVSDAPEGGLQVKTILAARAVSDAFPAITNMIGVRPDPKPWHPSGRAVDVMIPNPGSPEGVGLGDAIRDFALANAERFALQDVIWRGTYYTPEGPRGSGYGHYDHVHITTHGGGFPNGGEEYFS